MTTTRLLSIGLTVLLAMGGCEVYDPPPEVQLEIPDEGKWFPDSPLMLTFTEAVDPETLEITIWPNDLDIEGDIAETAEAVIVACRPSDEACTPPDDTAIAGLTIVLTEDRTEAALHQGEVFLGREGKPHILVVAAGLADDAGRERKVETWFPFQVSPTPTEGFVEVPMNTGVATLTADLTDILPSVYLRMFLDYHLDPEGKTVTIANVARLNGDHPPNTTDPLHIYPLFDSAGWAVQINGTFTPLSDGQFFFDTDVVDLSVKVLGLIPVTLEGFRLEATFTPEDKDGRDSFVGFMSATQALMGDPGDQTELGAVGASWEGFGLFADEIPEGLPYVCAADPCASLDDEGGDCQLADPWVAPETCE